MFTPQQTAELESTFSREGYLIFPGVVPTTQLAKLRDEVLGEFERVRSAGQLFTGGGTISGHLNCFPGKSSRFAYDALSTAGIIDLIKHLNPNTVRLPNVGCNLNLSGSSAQNYHIDGYAATQFMIANVAVVDTTIENGAMEASPGSHQRDYKYWQFVVAGHRSMRAKLKAGDVMIRTSSLWHRGMPNRTKTIRPMLGFTWEDGGSTLDDPFEAHEGKISFFTNRYGTNLAGQLRERAFATLPALGGAYLFLRSMLSQ